MNCKECGANCNAEHCDFCKKMIDANDYIMKRLKKTSEKAFKRQEKSHATFLANRKFLLGLGIDFNTEYVLPPKFTSKIGIHPQTLFTLTMINEESITVSSSNRFTVIDIPLTELGHVVKKGEGITND